MELFNESYGYCFEAMRVMYEDQQCRLARF